MEKKFIIRDINSKPITALLYHALRREIITGYEAFTDHNHCIVCEGCIIDGGMMYGCMAIEKIYDCCTVTKCNGESTWLSRDTDGSLKSWEADTGHGVSILPSTHKGWITQLIYWSEGKVMFSASVDGTITLWAPNGIPYLTLELGAAVYSMAWIMRRNELIAGFKGCLKVFCLSSEASASGMPLLHEGRATQINGHDDIVKCIISMESKVYTVGYDRKLIIYDVSSLPRGHSSSPPLKCSLKLENAHDAGITSLVVASDNDSGTWLATGSFDKRVKIWSTDGNVIHSIIFSAPVSSLCYVPFTRLIWVASGTDSALLYDPKSGENVTDFVSQLDDPSEDRYNKILQHLLYIPETGTVLGSTNRKEVHAWKYCCSSCVCIQECPDHIETLTYTNKVPILIFTGSFDGHVIKWEQLQLNRFMYSQENLYYHEQLLALLESEEESLPPGLKENIGSDENKEKKKNEFFKPDNRGFVNSLFIESLDILVMSSQDGKIFVWGFDEQTVKVLTEMQKQQGAGYNESSHCSTKSIAKYQLLISSAVFGQKPTRVAENQVTQQRAVANQEESVTNRVAGFMCRYVLNGHYGCSTGLAVVERNSGPGYSTTYLLSGGWDQRICLWNLETGKLVDEFHSQLGGHEAASDGIITDLDYSSEMNLFAYSSSDRLIYLRRFATKGTDMKLVATMSGHVSEVVQIKWNKKSHNWVSASEDGIIRVWSADGLTCEQIMNTGGTVTVLCIDNLHGLIVAAVKNTIKIYDSSLQLLQVSCGHTDTIKTIIHIPERDQYASAGWDGTLRLWNAYKPKRYRAKMLDEE